MAPGGPGCPRVHESGRAGASQGGPGPRGYPAPAGAARRLQERAAAGARPGRADPGCELTGSQPGQCWRKRRHHQLHVLCVHAAAARWPLGPRPIPDEERRRRTRSDRIAGSQTGSQQSQTLSDTRPRPAKIGAARQHVRPHPAPSGDGQRVPSKQRVTGSNPARRARSETYYDTEFGR
jgi:hypothetical protein